MGLLFGREVNHLGVTAAFEVEDLAVGGPAVLVVADELAVRVGAEGGLAGAGEAEEDGHIAVLAHVGRAVHGQHVLKGQDVIHHGEDALLHLAGVGAAGDDDEALA